MSSFFSKLTEGIEDVLSIRKDSTGIHPCPEAMYQWEYPAAVNPLAVATAPPPCDFPTLDWTLKVAKQLLISKENGVAIEASEKVKQDLEDKMADLKKAVDAGSVGVALLESIASDVTQHGMLEGAGDRPKSLDDYNELFKVIALPPIANDFQKDEVFAWMRVGGANPLMIHRITEVPDKFGFKEEDFPRVFAGDSLAGALAEGRVYFVDYEPLATLAVAPAGKYPQKYHYAPMALFAEAKGTGTLLPIAIQTQQTADGRNLFIADGSHNWMIAKTIVQMADGNFHEAVSHLGRTHFLIEPFVVATGRILGKEHPVSRLLWPHFEGTLFINYSALHSLVAPGGGVEQILMPTLDATLSMTSSQLQNYPINQQFLPKTFAARDVDDLKVYPYRDDSKLYWNAIEAWVKDYIELFYSGDENTGNQKVQNDALLQSWCNELIASGHVVGFSEGGRILTRDYLIQAVTMIIFTASVQHAAVNFPQLDFFTYAPNLPGACYAQFPKADGTPATEQDYIDMLPNRSQSIGQLDLAFLLGSAHYTELGQYPSNYFSGVGIPMVQKFQANIAAAGATIDQRNLTRRPYITLKPAGIPQSLNL